MHPETLRLAREAEHNIFYVERYQNCKYQNTQYYKGSEMWKLLGAQGDSHKPGDVFVFAVLRILETTSIPLSDILRYTFPTYKQLADDF